jgi:hypothetical protein
VPLPSCLTISEDGVHTRKPSPTNNTSGSSTSDDVDDTERFGWSALPRRLRYDDGGCAGDHREQGEAIAMSPSLEMRLGRQGWQQMESPNELTPTLKCLWNDYNK